MITGDENALWETLDPENKIVWSPEPSENILIRKVKNRLSN